MTHDSVTGNRRKPGRWLRTARWYARKNVDAMLGAVVVLLLCLLAWNATATEELRADLADARAALVMLRQSAVERIADEASWKCAPISYGKRESKYCWRERGSL